MGVNKFIWWFRFIINFPSLFRRANKEFNKNVKLGVEDKELIQLTEENIVDASKLIKKIKNKWDSHK